MPDVVSTSRDEELRRRAEAQNYQLQQQVDDLRRQLRELGARQQWLEDLYKQNEGRLAQFQISQDQFAQTITQTINARQVDEQRVKQQVGELLGRIDEPMKFIRDLRAQVTELGDSRRTDRERFTAELRQYEGLQLQIREVAAQIGMMADAQRQLRDVVHELDTVNGETRQEIIRLGELQRIEEQRLRRSGLELQEMVENLRMQFQDTTSRSQRIEDVRRQLIERLEAVEEVVGVLEEEDKRQELVLQRLDKQLLENHLVVQERAEGVRAAFDTELSELRQVGDQRMERYIGRFQHLEDRLRDMEQRLTELPAKFDALVARDLEIEGEREQIEEAHLRHEIDGLEAQLVELRARRNQKQAAVAKREAPGLLRSVRDARPPMPADDDYPTPPGGNRGPG